VDLSAIAAAAQSALMLETAATLDPQSPLLTLFSRCHSVFLWKNYSQYLLKREVKLWD